MAPKIASHFPDFLRRAPVAALLVVAVLAWLPGFFTLPPLDRDESRFAQATKQMLETGDFVAIRLGDQARDQKPIGIYWLQAASTAALNPLTAHPAPRNTIWTYRVPSAIGGFAAIVLLFAMVRGVAGIEAGFAAALLMGLTVLLWSEAKIAKTDAVLLATILGGQLVLLRTYLSAHAQAPPPSWIAVLLGWAAFGFGILVKGPVIVFVCGATALVLALWDRRAGWLLRLRPLAGLAVTLVIVAPWAIAIGIATHGAFFANSLGGDFAAKLVGGREAHGMPPGYFTLLAPATFWPATLVLLPGIVFGVRHRHEPAVRFLLAWAAITWLVFEMVPTKLPHYILPAYPALAALGGLWLTRAGSAQTRGERIALYASPVLFALVGLALAGALLWAPGRFGSGAPLWTVFVVAAGAMAVVAAGALMIRARRFEAVAAAALAAVLFYSAAGYGAVPVMDDLKVSPQIAQAVARFRQPGDPPVVIAGYAEPSARFLLGTKTRLTIGAKAGALAAREGGLVVVEGRDETAFETALAKGGGHGEALDVIDGLNYSNGRRVRLTVYRVTPAS